MTLRLEAKDHMELKILAARRHTSIQAVVSEAVKDLLAGKSREAAAVPEMAPDYIFRHISDAILKLDDARRILAAIDHERIQSIIVSAATDDISRQAGALLSPEADHPKPAEDLGSGKAQPGQWRKKR